MELSLELARDAELKTNAEQLHTNIKAFREFMEQICEPLNTRYEDIGNIPQREYTALKIIQIVDQLKQQYSSPLSTVLDNSFVLTTPNAIRLSTAPPESEEFIETAEANNRRYLPYHSFLDTAERLRNAILQGRLDKHLRSSRSKLLYEAFPPHGKLQDLI